MFRYTRLILVVFLTGCATQAGENTELPELFFPSPLITQPNTTLLETVETTLEVADLAIDEILEDKIKKQNKIYSLQKLVNQEEELIYNLEGSLNIKDSLLLTYEINNQILEEKIDEVATNLDHALHKCGNECYPTIVKLNKENKELLNYVDSLQNWVFYLDSLVMTNKKLSKQLNK
ncbi:hypothetical protein N8580_00070 [Akkermansiaceae bacterium]|jgi:hypothetical protein|nr:hypothetical protein [Akkermansiaceae bacterium]